MKDRRFRCKKTIRMSKCTLIEGSVGYLDNLNQYIRFGSHFTISLADIEPDYIFHNYIKEITPENPETGEEEVFYVVVIPRVEFNYRLGFVFNGKICELHEAPNFPEFRGYADKDKGIMMNTVMWRDKGGLWFDLRNEANGVRTPVRPFYVKFAKRK